ncbi:hypothetical protein, conserved [Trypanosoma brucei gambiense DAL972]|uniref:Uncharacterized protein n=2 Tax=Trypanosoma brucei TaxID=5691 RepID=D0A525_TRYB9|nr:hypothetical protein, conserved [Trypanosoma brucei gambiense DAL972]RHW69627.1 hypothetical protein DPX39_100127900 [Trypanosoma brucei equiperdum]CBH16369.1 hypothetical protein, conserved [Trypanosoma brucei gambiense DAL972]|eukprot:XP_011778633.1 hypothetical protein, conserved [Trypanosoma brucei gambiense DAL972]
MRATADKHVSFASELVTASWATANSKTRERNTTSRCGERPTDGMSLALFHSGSLALQAVDSLRLELELPLVTRYRVLNYLWRHCYQSWQEENAATLPPRPAGVEHSADEYLRICRCDGGMAGAISSTSLKLVDGITLHRLTYLADDAGHLHPYSRRLDPVTRPIVRFLRQTCTLQLSRRQNNIICLLPKLVEIIIILCYKLELSAQRYGQWRLPPRHLTSEGCNYQKNGSEGKNEREGGDFSLSRLTHTCNSRSSVSLSWTNRCTWWLARACQRASARPHRLFAHLRALLLDPGPMCHVKAGYLQFLAVRFFPDLPSIQYPVATFHPETFVWKSEDGSANGLEETGKTHTLQESLNHKVKLKISPHSNSK